MSMNLSDLLSSLETTPIEVMPELRQKILAEIRERYLDDIEPEQWKAYFENNAEDQRFQEFMDGTNSIVHHAIEKYLGVMPPKNFRYLQDTIWEESQSIWYEQEGKLQPIFDFLEHLQRNAQNALSASFPKSEKAFGHLAHSLLLDLGFQAGLFRYSKATNPSLVDRRRMMNVVGQVV
jgi:hypothetical protein